MSAHDTRDDGAAGASEEYQTDTRPRQPQVGFVTQEEHIGKLRHLEARVRREVAAEYVPLMAAHDAAIGELTALRAEVAALRPVVAAMERYGAALMALREAPTRDYGTGWSSQVSLSASVTAMNAASALAALALARGAHDDAPDAGGVG